MNFKETCQALFDHYVACYRARDANGCATIFSADAELYSPFGPPAVGRDAIATTHEDWVQEEEAGSKEIRVVNAGCDGDLGWCVARFSEGDSESGISLAVVSRQSDGNWLITHCSLNEA